jgi:hypothetical protein
MRQLGNFECTSLRVVLQPDVHGELGYLMDAIELTRRKLTDIKPVPVRSISFT